MTEPRWRSRPSCSHRSLGPPSTSPWDAPSAWTRRHFSNPTSWFCRHSDVRRSPEGYVEIAGADILLLVEIADSSLRCDKVRKASVYAAHDVADYWIADLNARAMIVHRRPSKQGYMETKTIRENEAIRPTASALAGVSVRLADLG